MRPQTLQSSLFRPLFQVGASLGIARERLLEAVGVDEALLARPDVRLPYAALQRVWTLLVEVGGSEPLAVRLAQSLEPTHVGLVGYVLVNSPDLRTSLQRYCRIHALLDPRTRWRVHQSPGLLRVELELDPQDAWASRLKHPVEGLLVAMVASGRALSGEDWRPTRVCVTHPRHEASPGVEAFLGVGIEYDAGANLVQGDEAAARLPIRHADIELGNLLHARAEAELAQLEAQEARSWRERVEEVLAAQPRTGDLIPADVAARLVVSERTLQRRLREEGVTFAGLEDAVRRDRAFQLLRDGRLPHFEIAFLLGFSDPSAFTRAFRRWSGTTPGQWQQAQAGKPGGRQAPESAPGAECFPNRRGARPHRRGERG